VSSVESVGEDVPFHLLLSAEEAPATAQALRLLISDEAHEPGIRRLAREVLAAVDAIAPDGEVATLTLTPQQMKITHSAVRLLLKDLRRDEPDELALLRSVLEKLPDEHVMRAIELD
jgi:hypothetical protein